MATLKLHKTLSEQVALLKSRGLEIADEQLAEELLFDINYYRLTGYLHDFKIPGTDNYQTGLSLNYII